MKGLKVVIFFLFILLVLLIAVGAYAYLKTDLFLTPQQSFTKYLKNDIEQLSSFNFKPFDEIGNLLSTTSTETTVYIPKKSSENSIKISTDTNNKISAEVNYSLDGATEPLSGIIAYSNNALGIKMDAIYDKYIVIENSNLDKLYENMGLTNDLPKELPEMEELKKYEETCKQLLEEYKGKFISKFDNKDNYTVEKNVEIVVNGETLKANKYSLKTTSIAVQNNFIDVVKELYQDERFIEIYNTIYEENPSELIEQFENMVSSSDIEDSEIEISVYEHSQKAVQTEIKSKNNSIKFIISETAITIENTTSSETETIKFENSFNGSDGKVILTYNSEEILTININKSGNEYNFSISAQKDGEDVDIAEIVFATGLNIKLDTFDSTNSVVVNDYTEEEFQQLVTELSSNLMKYFMNNPNSTLSMIMNSSNEQDDYEDFSSFDLNNEDNTLNPQNDDDPMISLISKEIEEGASKALDDYNDAHAIDSNANVNDYFNVDNIEKYCNGYRIELVNGNPITFKCQNYGDLSVYYAIVNIGVDGNDVIVSSVEVYTESDYNEL